LAFSACSGKTLPVGADGGSIATPADAACVPPDHVEIDGSIHPDASCLVSIDTPPLQCAAHVPVGTDVAWSSNPPSSGAHFPVWAASQPFTTPVPRGYYVHDLEHGAIVFLYKCDQADGCPAVVSTLQDAAKALPDDALCLETEPDVRVRVVITPDPL